jgi:hypothetical protein
MLSFSKNSFFTPFLPILACELTQITGEGITYRCGTSVWSSFRYCLSHAVFYATTQVRPANPEAALRISSPFLTRFI